MGKSVTPDAISKMLADPSPDSTSQIPEIVIQVVDLKSMQNSTTRFTFVIVFYSLFRRFFGVFVENT